MATLGICEELLQVSAVDELMELEVDTQLFTNRKRNKKADKGKSDDKNSILKTKDRSYHTEEEVWKMYVSSNQIQESYISYVQNSVMMTRI